MGWTVVAQDGSLQQVVQREGASARLRVDPRAPRR